MRIQDHENWELQGTCFLYIYNVHLHLYVDEISPDNSVHACIYVYSASIMYYTKISCIKTSKYSNKAVNSSNHAKIFLHKNILCQFLIYICKIFMCCSCV